MSLNEILGSLQGAGLREAAQVHTFVAYRSTEDGGEEKVTVEVIDRGPEAISTPGRYSCSVTNGEQSASGNTADTIAEAIFIVHWSDLNKAD